MIWKFEGLNTEYISDNPETAAIKLRKLNNLKEDHKIIILNDTHNFNNDDILNSNSYISEQPDISKSTKKSKIK